MKKTTKTIAMAVAAIVAGVAITACGGAKQVAQAPSPKSGAEAKAKEWQAEGFKTTGAYSTFTMFDLLTSHNNKVLSDQERYVPLQGTATAGDLSTAKAFAQNDAALQYSTLAGSEVSGGIAREFSTISNDQKAKIMGAYTQKVAKFIVPYMKESLSVYKIENNKTVVEAYFIIDEQNARNVRKQSIDEALKETAMEQVFGSAVDDWVKKFVKNE
jgi:hypothetical protein